MIDLYTAPTHNGWKISIALEEMQLAYRYIQIDIFKLQQKSPEFLALNPNGRIPVIVDRDNGDYALMESGAILLYLAEKSGQLLPRDLKQRWTAIQWLCFQMAGIGPMHGQAGVFLNYFPVKYPDVIGRFQKESRRLYEVLNGRLAQHAFVADEYSVADIACYTWSISWQYAGVDISGLEHLKRWQGRIAERPAVARGIAALGQFDLTWDEVLREAPKMITM
jgi:GSH-dependent disulfide-bond oxidoreductase